MEEQLCSSSTDVDNVLYNPALKVPWIWPFIYSYGKRV